MSAGIPPIPSRTGSARRILIYLLTAFILITLILWQTGTLAGTAWNVIPDPGFCFYADPFPFVHRGRSYIFVEDWDHRRNKAVISVVPFGESGPSGPA